MESRHGSALQLCVHLGFLEMLQNGNGNSFDYLHLDFNILPYSSKCVLFDCLLTVKH